MLEPGDRVCIWNPKLRSHKDIGKVISSDNVCTVVQFDKDGQSIRLRYSTEYVKRW